MKIFYNLLLTVAISIPFFTQAQTIHDVDVVNGAFNPSHVDLEVGDIVRWTNSQGFHNVDANASDFPDNPEAFGNTAGSEGWVYEHQFTIAGDYNYWCGVHTESMHGSLTVSESTGINDLEKANLISFYPNPVVSFLKWKVNEGINVQGSVLTLYNINGKQIANIQLSNQSQLDISHYESGMYFFQIKEADVILQTGKLLVLTP